MGSKIIAFLGLFLAVATLLMIPSPVASDSMRWPDPRHAVGRYPSTIGYGKYGGYPGGGYGGYGGYPCGGFGGYGGYPGGGYGGGYGGYRGGYP